MTTTVDDLRNRLFGAEQKLFRSAGQGADSVRYRAERDSLLNELAELGGCSCPDKGRRVGCVVHGVAVRAWCDSKGMVYVPDDKEQNR